VEKAYFLREKNTGTCPLMHKKTKKTASIQMKKKRVEGRGGGKGHSKKRGKEDLRNVGWVFPQET